MAMMHDLFGFLGLVTLSALSLVGCGGTGGSGGTGGTGGVTSIARIVVVREWNEVNGFLEPLEAVEICDTDTANCVQTDAAGRATVWVPIDQEFSFTAEKDGYTPYLLSGFMPAEPEIFPRFGMSTEQRLADLHALVMSPYPMQGTGSIVVVFLTPIAGATLELGYAAGKAYYYDEQGNWDANLPATTSSGRGPGGGFTEVDPGEVEIQIGGTAEGCVVVSGWPGEVKNSVRVPILAGHLSWVLLSCEVSQ
jgi:hypothetical protein